MSPRRVKHHVSTYLFLRPLRRPMGYVRLRYLSFHLPFSICGRRQLILWGFPMLKRVGRWGLRNNVASFKSSMHHVLHPYLILVIVPRRCPSNISFVVGVSNVVCAWGLTSPMSNLYRRRSRGLIPTINALLRGFRGLLVLYQASVSFFLFRVTVR